MTPIERAQSPLQKKLKGEEKMEAYINSIRSGAMTVSELIAFLQQFDPNTLINIGLTLGCQLDIYVNNYGIVIK